MIDESTYYDWKYEPKKHNSDELTLKAVRKAILAVEKIWNPDAYRTRKTRDKAIQNEHGTGYY